MRHRRARAIVAALVVLTVMAGLASRRFPEWQPAWMARYAGDTLWAMMVYWGLAWFLPTARPVVLAGCALALSWGVECSQLWHAPWLDGLRATTAGALALGQGFLWSDLVCYAVGVLLAVIVDQGVLAFNRKSLNALP
ncbi:hypothetical membrane protein [Gemmatimonas aurantiaca T-27]|nr:DUF2809 domain-containing protein [Gemmatimonas aurantiaca]BAH40696.1 hypothetical membrane protein [Gemmatimonas aurantiaca T-27]